MSGKVLFVDDQEAFLKLVEIKLKNEKYEKFFTIDTDEAIKIIEKEDIDVVISDMDMPQSGLKLLKILKEKYPQVVRITLSGLYQPKNFLDAINHGEVFRYIVKPWKVDEEGRQIIRDAVAYAELMKFKFYCDCNTDVVSIEKLKDILKQLEIESEIVDIEERADGDINLNLAYVLRVKE